jgi:hypothetical protein
MDERQRLQQAFIEAGRALLEATGAGTFCAPIEPGLWIAIGEPDSIRRLLPDEAANDEVGPPAGN